MLFLVEMAENLSKNAGKNCRNKRDRPNLPHIIEKSAARVKRILLKNMPDEKADDVTRCRKHWSKLAAYYDPRNTDSDYSHN